jgi:DNA-binding transcriptional LysR family regulator
MDTKYLKTFLAVAQTKSFSLAADQVHLTQPAVSKRINQLEEELGLKLFDRVGRQVSLTEAGEVFQRSTRQLINELDQALSEVQSLDAEAGGTLSIGISHHLGLHRLPPLLREFSRQNPKVNLDIKFMDSEKAHEEVLRGDIELAAITFASETDEKVSSLLLWRDHLRFVVSRDHELASRPKIDLLTLSEHPCLLPSMATYTGRIIRNCFEQEKLSLSPVLNTNYMETLARMTEIGLGWSVVPETLAEHPDLVLLDVPVELSRDLGIIYNNQRTQSRAAKAFLSCVQNADLAGA